MSALVYSTESGRMCPGCRQPVAACRCQSGDLAPSPAGPVRLVRERKGRGGKVVTVLRGAPLGPAALADLARSLRASCGSGGTVREGVIELQGDHVARLLPLLRQRGWRVQVAGG